MKRRSPGSVRPLIEQYLAEHPGKNCAEIAFALDMERNQVTRVLREISGGKSVYSNACKKCGRVVRHPAGLRRHEAVCAGTKPDGLTPSFMPVLYHAGPKAPVRVYGTAREREEALIRQAIEAGKLRRVEAPTMPDTDYLRRPAAASFGRGAAYKQGGAL